MTNTRQARANSGNRIAFGILIIIVSFFCFLSDVGALGGVGRMVYSFLAGFFGLASYAYSIMGIILGIAVTFNIRPKASLIKALTYFGLLILAIFALHIYTSSAHIVGSKYGAYLVACYANTNTAGGMLFGIVAYPLMKLITSVGALVVAWAFFVLAIFALIPTLRRNVTYTATSSAQRGGNASPRTRRFKRGSTKQPQSGTEIASLSAPAITDLSQPASNGLYVVDVDGDRRSRRRRRTDRLGAEGYEPINRFDVLYPNRNGGYEDDERINTYTHGAGNSQNAQSGLDSIYAAQAGAYSSQPGQRQGAGYFQSETQTNLARSILFGDKPDSETIDRFGKLNSGRRIEPLAVPTNSAKATEMATKLGIYDDANKLRQQYIERYRAEDAISDNNSVVSAAPAVDRGADIYTPEYLERLKQREKDRLIGLDVADDSTRPQTAGGSQNRQVATPARLLNRGGNINPTAQKAIESVSQVNVGMLGAVNKAAQSGERTADSYGSYGGKTPIHDTVTYTPVRGTPKMPTAFAGNSVDQTAARRYEVSGETGGTAAQQAQQTRYGQQPARVPRSNAAQANGAQTLRQGNAALNENGVQNATHAQNVQNNARHTVQRDENNHTAVNGQQGIGSQTIQHQNGTMTRPVAPQTQKTQPQTNRPDGGTRSAGGMRDSETAKIGAANGETLSGKAINGEDKAQSGANTARGGANNSERGTQGGGYTMAPVMQPRETVRAADVHGGDVPTEPLPVQQPVTGGDMSRSALQQATDIAGTSARDKERDEINARIEGIRMDRQQSAPKVPEFEREASLREEKMKAAKEKGLPQQQKSSDKKERVRQITVDQVIQETEERPPRRPYVAPPVNLLEPPILNVDQNEDFELKKEKIINTLDLFSISAKVTDVIQGPTFTMYKLKVDMPRGRTITSMYNIESDIAMKMEVDSVRILAPIPGEDAVGIEVPNKVRRIVNISEIINSQPFNTAKDAATFALGTNINGVHRVVEVRKLPHVLIAGATGAGKSCCINSLIVSMLYKASPDDVRFILIDPKRVELSIYAGIPHLLMDEIICDTDKAIRALNWAVQEMDRRMKFFGDKHYRDIEDYNSDCVNTKMEKMPRIIVIVDEFADLMSTGKKAVEDTVNRLARLARASGIHLVLATQRPSVDVISGTIKNNFPSRIAFKVTQSADSKTVLDTVGAEKLLGYGDLFFMTPGSQMERMQGAFISNNDVRNVVEFIKKNNDSYFDEKVKDAIFKEEEPKAETSKDKGRNKSNELPPELFDALQLGIQLRQDDPSNPCISTSNLQRKLGLGFPKASRIKDLMDTMGYLSPDEKNPRNKYVNITQEELDELRRMSEEQEDDE